jgi:ABC-type amino acid transport substrate-binding protein
VAAFSSQRAVLDALAAGEVEGALVRAPDLAAYLQDHPDAAIEADLAATPDDWARWNVVMEVHRPGGALADALNAAIDDLTADGTIAAILEDYGVPYHAPFRQTRRD